ncbi:barstar family protein [Nocardioides lianchengensis]|uniref:Barstar (Barnase inhibitor) n=1 Tax=Nocardioides lianchengensis TaxID=1045774 RepID=A0A1G6TD25_9ACTN|nr:barstar family protein [Nocardioides lianchengensis]NYG11793.1 hypothetical protein [Nocardioides lianchengensis]SDD26961.1 Barstar (barnase inhibitor) [Nocardioides lianchengensis]
MASWEPGTLPADARDLRLVQDCFVTLFWQTSVLDETVRWLSDEGYHCVTLAAARWGSESEMHSTLAETFDFPASYGHNLDALDDCLDDVAHGEYGWPTGATGLVLALVGFDQFVEVDRPTAQSLLDVLAGAARTAVLVGNRLIVLAQSGDPRLELEPVGGAVPTWDGAEWRNAARGL